jgi:radical SAM superfamily enzyme YgiQ (UPF0313 family)
MYRDVRFSIERIEQIEKDLKEAQQLYPDTKRVFLVNGDAFVLSARRLKPIAELVHQYLPKVEVITMYASVNNIKGKTDIDLVELQKLGIDELWVGVETGHAKTLEYHNKGFSLQDSYKQLERLNKAGIKFLFGFMYGAAGSGMGIENAKETAKLINATSPMGIVPTTLGAFGNSPLAADVTNGLFEPASEMEILEEQKKLIELVDVQTLYLGIHGINTVGFDAKLPEQREQALKRVNHTMKKLDKSYLSSIPERHSI